MNRKEKNLLKLLIGQFIDLANGKFTDDEINSLYDAVKNKDAYNGRSYTKKRSFTDRSLDGKYTRNEETTYTFRSNENRIYIDEDYQYHDDDGQSGSSHVTHDTARDILRLLWQILHSP